MSEVIQTEKLFDIRSKIEEVAETGRFKAKVTYVTRKEHEFDLYVAINLNRAIWLACTHEEKFFEGAVFLFLEKSSGVMDLDELGVSLGPMQFDDLERELTVDGLWSSPDGLYLP